jgi:hypothetical protein
MEGEDEVLRYLPLLTAVALGICCGLVHGFWTDRWTRSRAPAEAAARLTRVPLEAGDWQAEPLPFNERETEAISGRLYRRYVNRLSGSAVTVALVSGLPGPVAIHTPDVCYKANGFKVASPIKYRHAATAGAPAAELLTADLEKARAAEVLHQRIFWSWTTAGTWSAPDNPRWQFAAEPVLYKLYLVREMSAADEPLEEDPCIDLMRQLLPQLHQVLFTGP